MGDCTVPDERRAAQACAACKRRKGRCDKALPSCSFCTSKGWSCHYIAAATELRVLSLSGPSFPAVLFLDHDVFRRSLLNFPPIGHQVPSYILSELGDLSQRRLVASQFFATIHKWMPIVSKRRLFDHLLNPLVGQRTDVALLCLSMKLAVWAPSTEIPDPNTTTYISAKQFLHSADISGSLTLPVLQAALIIAIYEIGHAIYPAAYLSVGACAQYAVAMGLGWNSISWEAGTISSVEIEERRRVWWAVVILERFISLGWHGRPLITKAPSGHELLPSDDAAWDEGREVPNYPITTSLPENISLGRFARLAQATHLLDRVLRHVQDSTMPRSFLEEEAIQLDKALRALVEFIVREVTRRQMKLCCSAALCHSAMAILHTPCLSPQSEVSVSRLLLARKTMEHLSVGFLPVSNNVLKDNGLPLNEISPLTFHWAYEAAVHFTRLSKSEPRQETTLALETVQHTLQKANTRWRSAGAYLDILEAGRTMDFT